MSMSTQLEGGDSVQDFDQFHGRLSNKLHELEDAVPENYYMTVEYCPFNADTERFRTKDRVSITIRSDDSVSNKGEAGIDYFHAILRERGGLEILTRSSFGNGRRDYLDDWDTKSKAWRFYVNAVERAI